MQLIFKCISTVEHTRLNFKCFSSTWLWWRTLQESVLTRKDIADTLSNVSKVYHIFVLLFPGHQRKKWPITKVAIASRIPIYILYTSWKPFIAITVRATYVLYTALMEKNCKNVLHIWFKLKSIKLSWQYVHTYLERIFLLVSYFVFNVHLHFFAPPAPPVPPADPAPYFPLYPPPPPTPKPCKCY